MNRSNKKGFTIVELVIVIAVIAILAAVLIPTIAGLVKKANVSKDTQLIRNLNTALAAEVDGCDTMAEAIAAAAKFGYDVGKINASATDNEILWDSVAKVFCYLNDGKVEYISEVANKATKDADYWVIDKVVSQVYSTYYIGVNTIDIDFAANICLVTDGTDFTITAPLATISHYGKLTNLTIESIAPLSYHEYGTVAHAIVKEGRIVVENGGAVSAVIVDPATDNAEITLEGSVGHVFGTSDALENNLKGTYQAEEVKTVESVENFIVGAVYVEETKTYYDSFAEALAAEGKTIVLMNDVAINEPVTIESAQNVVLNLHGFTLSYDSITMGEAMITNKGNLTINDSVGTGVINYNYTGAADSSRSNGNYTIENKGTLTVNGGEITIANLAGHVKYPINNDNSSGDAILVINGGHLYNYNAAAIRLLCHNATYKNSVTINGGLIEGYSTIWMQNPGSGTVNGDLTITGGEIRTTAKNWVAGTAELKDVGSRIYCSIVGDGGAWSESSFVKISGGIFNDNVRLAEEAPAVTITGGTFNGKCEK